MKIDIKHRFSLEALFSYECENNNIRITLEAAIKAKADLRGADLSVADLSGANLRGASLSVADLSVADLSVANLRGASLSVADLSVANLRGADLSGANLRGASLSVADLSVANLRGADLSGADLSGASLSGADLSGADLSGADLSWATGNTREVISFQCAPYYGVYTAETMQIGCYKYHVATFFKDSEKRKAEFSESDIEWRNRNKRWIQAMIKANPAVPTGHEGKGND